MENRVSIIFPYDTQLYGYDVTWSSFPVFREMNALGKLIKFLEKSAYTKNTEISGWNATF